MTFVERKYENSTLNISIISYINSKQNIYFKGKDIASAFWYRDTDDSNRKYIDDQDKIKSITRANHRGNPNRDFINESGFYQLIWVFSMGLVIIIESGFYQ